MPISRSRTRRPCQGVVIRVGFGLLVQGIRYSVVAETAADCAEHWLCAESHAATV